MDIFRLVLNTFVLILYITTLIHWTLLNDNFNIRNKPTFQSEEEIIRKEERKEDKRKEERREEERRRKEEKERKREEEKKKKDKVM